MKKIEIERIEHVKDENGDRLVSTFYTREFPDEAVRHRDLCTLCGWSTYPECMEWCPNAKREREREAAKKAKEAENRE